MYVNMTALVPCSPMENLTQQVVGSLLKEGIGFQGMNSRSLSSKNSLLLRTLTQQSVS